MKKIAIEVDGALLTSAQAALLTTTESETVNAALAEAVATAARRSFLKYARAGGLADLRDPDVMAGAWRQ